MVGINLNRIFNTFEIFLLLPKAINDYQKFFVINFIINFRKGELLKVKGN